MNNHRSHFSICVGDWRLERQKKPAEHLDEGAHVHSQSETSDKEEHRQTDRQTHRQTGKALANKYRCSQCIYTHVPRRIGGFFLLMADLILFYFTLCGTGLVVLAPVLIIVNGG